jgi:MFS family permease
MEMAASNRLAVILVLGTAQTLAWASTYYLPAILADRIAAELGMSSTWFFGAFSGSLVVAAMVGPRIGRTVDAIGGREVLAASNVIIALGLAALGLAYSQPMLWVAWFILGLGMGVGLYDTAFAASWMVVAAKAVHLPRLLEAAGATTVQAVAAGALIGPSQVGARILEASLLRRFHPMVSARLSVALHPIGAGVLAVFGATTVAAPFTVLHGAGSGILTIARGTVPLAMFGPENYGYRLGLLGAPSRVAMAAAPLLFGVLIERYGAGTLVFSSALSLAALVGLCTLRIGKS